MAQLLQEMQALRTEMAAMRSCAAPYHVAVRAPMPLPTVVDSDTDEPSGVPLRQAVHGLPFAVSGAGAMAGMSTYTEQAPTSEDASTMLLPLLSQATQQAAVDALADLKESLRSLEESSSKNMNPHVQQAIRSLRTPLQTLHRLIAPQRLLGVHGGSGRHPVLPVWVLVDFGEVNYNVLPLALKQFHRLMAQRVDDTGEAHILFATRQQFATDDGYIQIPLHSVVNVVLGGVPRPYRAQRLGIDGRMHPSDLFLDSKQVMSIRTLVQTIVVQFEGAHECRQWHALVKEFVQQRPIDQQDL